MTADPTHRHDQFHRGQVPTGQLADGTATSGFAPLSNGDGSVTWGPAGGGGGACDHEHTSEEFTALGGSPETFTLAHTPLWLRRVFVQGLRVAPSAVGGSGDSVDVETTSDDVVVIDYEVECGALGTALAVPGTDVEFGGSHGNLVATIETTGPAVVTINITSDLSSPTTFDTYMWVTNNLASFDITLPVSQQPSLPNSVDVSASGTYYFPAPAAGTWYLIIGTSDYATDLTGAGTCAVTYATGTPTDSLAFPGTDGSGSFLGNILASGVISGPTAIFITIDSDLPDNYSLGSHGDVSDDIGYYSAALTPFPAGTYVVACDPTDTTFDIFAHPYFSVAYDAGLTNSGTYEIVALP